MRFKKSVQDILNKQVNAEFWSAYLYLSMSAYLAGKGLNGLANWMRVQYQEEVSHAMKIFDYVIARGGEMKLEPIERVETEWAGVKEIFESTYEHECKVTDMIHNCYEVALKERDHATANMLQWFIDEQAEEEESALEILDKLKLVGDNSAAMYMLDQELGARTFVDATQAE
ncbi:MAG: ferritin [Bacteroidales bacterium]|jgi:ferritin|nr:ferritin [Bacteroidales bacterium]MDD3844628.1 ferritin [Bacteroidales bacterium]